MGNGNEEHENAVMIVEFGIEITSDGGIQGYTRGNGAIIKLFDAQKWFDETMEKVVPVVKEVSERFNDIFVEKTGATPAGSECGPIPTAADILTEDKEDKTDDE